MSLLDQSRALTHVQGLTPSGNQLMVPHPLEGPPNPDVLLALLARNKALEAMEYRSRTTKMVEAALALTLMTDNSAAESKVIVDECQNNLNKITEKDPENLMVSSIKHNSIEVIESEVPQIEQ
ncbi:hypothetical protein RN001_008394 [Aquatica leii]|uniref:Uncharacterized protein n=1 Tax=Aquatica leii TaxID=1421715 RepID=A0AAN7QIZ5_9COLE|nr:hypothetical protein RN001_008394 [Aquatica leii]